MPITPPGVGGGGNPPIISSGLLPTKSDIYGSTMTRGVSSNRFDRAVRRCLVSNVANDFNGLNAAINAAMFGRGQHQSFNRGLYFLPLAYAKATRFGPSKVWVDLYYQRGRITVPTQPPALIASFRGNHEHTIVYKSSEPDGGGDPAFDSYGFPNGKLYFDPDDPNEPVGRAWRRPVVKIYVTTVLSSAPLGAVADGLGKINPRGLTFGGYLFPENSLRFDSVDVDWIEDNNGVPKFVTDYVFSATSTGWFRQAANWNKTTKKWEVSTEQEFDRWSGITFPWE